MQHLCDYGKQAVLWCADLTTSIILLVITLEKYNFMLDGKALYQNVWIFIAGLLLVTAVFFLAPSGIHVIKHRTMKESMEVEEFFFNKIASAIRNFCYIMLIAFAIVISLFSKKIPSSQLYVQ